MAKQAKPEYKVLAAVLCNQAFVQTPFAKSLAQLALPRGTIIEFVSEKSYEAQCNKAIEMALAGDYTHLCILDNDMVYAPNTLWELLKADVDIVAGFSLTRKAPCKPLFFQIREDDEWRFDLVWPPIEEGVHEVGAIGTPAMMIKRDVLRRLPGPWFIRGQNNGVGKPVSPDVYFCVVARQRGLSVHCHTKVRPQHLVEHGYVPIVKDGSWEVDAVYAVR
jgi:hypothetical protein